MITMIANVLIIRILILLFAFSSVNNAIQSTIGRDFVFGFPNNADGVSALLVAIVSNANDQPTNINITSIYSSFRTINAIVQPNTILKFPIEPANIQARYADRNGSSLLVIENKGIRIQSTLEIAVYAHTEITNEFTNFHTGDSFTILPTDALNMQYYAVGTVDYLGYPNIIMAVAYQDNTTIMIGSQQVTLNALQVVTLAIRDIISGISVNGNKPFAAFSGNMKEFGDNSGITDYVMTTLLPTSHWGTQYTLVGITDVSNSDQQYQIVASQNGTNIMYDGFFYLLNAGEYRIIQITQSTILMSNYPIQVVQMIADFGAFFLQEISVDKWSNMSVLFQPTGYIANNEFRTFIYRIYTTLDSIGRIQIDNTNISALLYRRIAQTNYYYFENYTTSQTHRISALNANVTYSVISYSEGTFIRCGFPVAFALSAYPQDCSDLHNSGANSDGPYKIRVGGVDITVWCDMTNGGYTVIQSRSNGPDDSFSIANYAQYQAGFGDITTTITNYWLGLDNMYTLLTNRQYSLVVDVCCNSVSLGSVTYNSFSIGDSSTFYRLNVSIGTGGCDGFNYKVTADEYSDNGSQFYATGVTYNNPDPPQSLCDSLKGNNNGGWWFGSCIENPNGYLYYTTQFADPTNCVPNATAGHGIGVTWCGTNNGVTKMRMKIIAQSNLQSMKVIEKEADGYCATK